MEFSIEILPSCEKKLFPGSDECKKAQNENDQNLE